MTTPCLGNLFCFRRLLHNSRMLFRNSVLLSGNQQRNYLSGCSSRSNGASCKPFSLLSSYYTSRVYPAGCFAPCRAGFDTVRFAFAKGEKIPALVRLRLLRQCSAQAPQVAGMTNTERDCFGAYTPRNDKQGYGSLRRAQ